MSTAHIISSRSDHDPSSALLVALHIVMWTTFAWGLIALVVIFLIT